MSVIVPSAHPYNEILKLYNLKSSTISKQFHSFTTSSIFVTLSVTRSSVCQ